MGGLCALNLPADPHAIARYIQIPLPDTHAFQASHNCVDFSV